MTRVFSGSGSRQSVKLAGMAGARLGGGAAPGDVARGGGGVGGGAGGLGFGFGFGLGRDFGLGLGLGLGSGSGSRCG